MPGGTEPGASTRAARKLATFAQLPVFVLLWLVPAWAMIGLASLAILLVPFRRLAPIFGRNIGPVAFVPMTSPAQAARAHKIATAIAVAAKYAPFRSNCYPQAIVAHVLCRLYRIPYALHFGARIEAAPGEASGLKAHAWVVSGPVAVSGGNASFGEFSTVGCFVSRGV